MKNWTVGHVERAREEMKKAAEREREGERARFRVFREDLSRDIECTRSVQFIYCMCATITPTLYDRGGASSSTFANQPWGRTRRACKVAPILKAPALRRHYRLESAIILICSRRLNSRRCGTSSSLTAAAAAVSFSLSLSILPHGDSNNNLLDIY